MKTILQIVITFLLMFPLALYGQGIPCEEIPNIEVNGTADIEIEPNEIYIKATLEEYFKGRTKVTINEQEELLVNGLKQAGIDNENIELDKAESGYVRAKFLKKDVINKKVYQIKATNVEEVRAVFIELEKALVRTAYIVRVDHSEIETFKRELRIKAIKNAKQRAEDLVTAIGNTLGMPLKIKETYDGGITVRGSRSNSTDYYVDGIRMEEKQFKRKANDDYQIQYKKIRLYSYVYVKFEVK